MTQKPKRTLNSFRLRKNYKLGPAFAKHPHTRINAFSPRDFCPPRSDH